MTFLFGGYVVVAVVTALAFAVFYTLEVVDGDSILMAPVGALLGILGGVIFGAIWPVSLLGAAAWWWTER